MTTTWTGWSSHSVPLSSAAWTAGLRAASPEKSAQQRLGPRPVALFAGQQVEPRKHAEQRAVARRRRAVLRVLGSHQHVRRVCRNLEVAAAVVIAIVGVEPVLPPHGLVEIAALRSVLEQRQRRGRQIGVVLEEGEFEALARAPAVGEPVARHHLAS